MDLYDRTVESQGFDPDADDLFLLERGEDSIQDAGFGPAVHTGVDGMPAAESLRQRPPFTAVLGDVKNPIEDVQVGDLDVPPLLREAALDSLKLLFGDQHAT